MYQQFMRIKPKGGDQQADESLVVFTVDVPARGMIQSDAYNSGSSSHQKAMAGGIFQWMVLEFQLKTRPYIDMKSI